MTLNEIRSELERLRESVNYLHSELTREMQRQLLRGEYLVYGGQTRAKLEANAPKGWSLGEFRQVRRGEYFLCASSGRSVTQEDNNGHVGEWRIIVTRKPPEPTIESVYGKPLTELKPPAGYAFTGEFRAHAHDREYQLSPESMEAMYPNCHQPRLILRKCKRLVFDILGENRPVKDGEWFEPYFGGIYRAAKSDTSILALRILSEPRVEE